MQLKLRPNPRRSSGFTLIELLVGLAVGAIVLLGVTYSWTTAVRNNVYVLSVTALNNDMRTIMQIVTADVRRATAADESDPRVEISPDKSCISFNAGFYDSAEPSPEIMRATGYRLKNDSFQMFTGADPSNACESDDNWNTLLANGDRGISINSFVVDPDKLTRCLNLNLSDDSENVSDTERRCSMSEADGHVELLAIEITMSGSISLNGEDRAFSFHDVVKIRNDRIFKNAGA